VALSLALIAGLISGGIALASPGSASPGAFGSLIAADSSLCEESGVSSSPANYQTVVTQHAGNEDGPLDVYTDTVTVSWCTDGDDVQILSSSQAPSVETAGYTSLDGLEIKVLNAVGFTFGVTPATAPAPTIDNEPGYASTTASGLSFNENFNLGKALVVLAGSRLASALTEELAGEVEVLVHNGQLGRLGAWLEQWWGKWVALVDSWINGYFRLPSWAADLVKGLSIHEIKEAVTELETKFVDAVTPYLEALGRDISPASVSSAVQSALQEIAGALSFTTVEWAPEITVTVYSRLDTHVSDEGSKSGLYITVGKLIEKTTP
jgi:hypothetical protein